MIWRILLMLLLAYVLYRILFNFIIPLVAATRKIKKDFREMQDKMNEFMKNQQESHPTPKEPTKEKAGDYIDFEEVK